MHTIGQYSKKRIGNQCFFVHFVSDTLRANSISKFIHFTSNALSMKISFTLTQEFFLIVFFFFWKMLSFATLFPRVGENLIYINN